MENEWGGDIFLNHGTSNSRGTLIAFPEGFEKNVLKYGDDKDGRIQILAFEHKKKISLLEMFTIIILKEGR